MAERVVITGIGVVSPIGNDLDTFRASLRAGESGIGPITRFDASDYATKISAEVKDFDTKQFLDRRDARKMDRFSQFAVVASLQALEQAALKPGESVDPGRIGVVLGIGIGGFETLGDAYENLLFKGPRRVPPMSIPKLIGNIGPGNVAIHVNAQGPAFSMATACASGTDAITNGTTLIRGGIVDAVIAGGVEAIVTPLGVAGFNVIHALSTKYNDTPKRASRPFDRDRDGFVIGEGAGVMILESLTHAKARGAKILAEVVGTSMTCDANHLTQPHPEARGAVAAMRAALAEAKLNPEDVDYINAHGTSTPINDPIETKAIKQVFGSHAYKLKVSSTKSMTGHCIGAAGGIEAIASVIAIRDGFIPPTINLENPDPECDLDYVPNRALETAVDVVMSDSLGFGGHNGVIILRRYRE